MNIQNNTTELQAVLDAVNKLPVATPARVAVEEKDVNFYDYDGTLLYSYTLAEAQALTELPEGPDWHEELVFDGWNWDLSNVKSLTQPMDIGAMYTTADGATHLVLQLDSLNALSVTLRFNQSADRGVSVDWGDGSQPDTIAGSGNVAPSHTYAQMGAYTIRLKPLSGEAILGTNSASTTVLGAAVTSVATDVVSGTLLRVHQGSNIAIGMYALHGCRGLEYVTFERNASLYKYCFEDCYCLRHINLPKNIASSGYAFSYCYALERVVCSDSGGIFEGACFYFCPSLRRLRCPVNIAFTGASHFYQCYTMREVYIGSNLAANSMFYNCRVLEKCLLHEGAASIGTTAFYRCFSLREMDIPASVTTIGSQAFFECYSLTKLKFRSANPPTVASSNAFTSLPSSCVVEVPKGSLATYQNATNYASIAARMVEV